MTTLLSRATGALYGQLIGDSLGSLVEFRSATSIASEYPHGVRELIDGGPFSLSAGQPTDDSEMALALARSIVRNGTYSFPNVIDSYREWARSEPFDIGNTCADALLNESYNPASQANGALMRVSPLAIYGATQEDAAVEDYAELDCRITHVSSECIEANRAFATALARVIRGELDMGGAAIFFRTYPGDFVARVVAEPIGDVSQSQGWVAHVLRMCVYECEHFESFEESLVRVVGRGGDTDTNAAIVGALLGGLVGVDAIPQRWIDVIDNCQPRPGTLRPRPEKYWPGDVRGLARNLVS